ncbi:MAG: membrane fusion protein (multidrug efflux system) [Gammaproteobacteria bacterium]|jgi:membrane fusion protein (multidrug efflux system)
MSVPRPVAVEDEGTPVSEPEMDRGVGQRPRRRRWLPLLLIIAAFSALGVWGADYLHARFLFVHETDARVVADMVAVGARVEGWISSVDVHEGERVSRGQRLAQVDSHSAVLRLSELRAEMESLEAERARVSAKRRMVDEQTTARLRTVESQRSAARALAESLEHEARLTTNEFERSQALSKKGVVSVNALDRARTAYLRARQELLSARSDVAASDAKLGEMRAQRQELAVLDADAAVLEKRIAQHAARVERQALAVADHEVRAPSPGVISRAFVETGEYLRLGQRIVLMHDPDRIWVEANVRETEIGRVQVGQPVKIVVDAYPDVPVVGWVERIGQATTGEFALLPTPNPSGNFTKVTQRLPVRIAVDKSEALLRPGMLVEIDIDIVSED